MAGYRKPMFDKGIAGSILFGSVTMAEHFPVGAVQAKIRVPPLRLITTGPDRLANIGNGASMARS